MMDERIVLGLYFCVIAALVCAAWGRLLALVLKGGPIWPLPQPRIRRVPWGWAACLALIGLYLLVNLLVIEIYFSLKRLGMEADGEPANRASPMMQLTVTSIANVITLALSVLLLRRSARARLDDFGLERGSLAPAARDGAWMYFLIVPLVMLTMLVAVQIWSTNPHQLETMIREQMDVGTLLVAFLGGTFAAPLFEEFLFRGVIQQALTQFWIPRPRSLNQDGDPVIAFDFDDQIQKVARTESEPDQSAKSETRSPNNSPLWPLDADGEPNPWAAPQSPISGDSQPNSEFVAGISPLAASHASISLTSSVALGSSAALAEISMTTAVLTKLPIA